MKQLWKVAAAFFILALCITACAQGEGSFVTAADNGILRLSVNEETLEMRILDQRTGEEYSTKEMDGKNGNKTTKNSQKSDVRVTYVVNEFVGTTSSMDSYSMSVEYGNYSIEYIENGVEVHYEIGDKTITMDDLPKMVPLDKYYGLLLPYWSTKDDNSFREFYRVYQDSMWVRTDDGNIGKVKLNNLYKLFYEQGQYTYDDLVEDNAAYGYEISKVNPRIDLTVRFTIEGEDFLAAIPCDGISFTNGNDVTRIDLLPYFMTAGKEDVGYIFVPDGSGSLIRLNNGKLTALAYTDKVYGSDVLMNVNTYTAESEPVRMPVYGIKTQNGAMLAIIEKGAALAGISAEISGRSDEFNAVYSYFTLRDIEFLSVLGKATGGSPRYPTDVYDEDIVVRYKFLHGENADYTGMAHVYRAYLLENGMLEQRDMPQQAPFFAQIIGAVRQTKFFAGIPYESTAVATTLRQAKEILGELVSCGVNDPVLILKGYLKGGVKHESLSALRFEGSAGSTRDLSDLTKTAEETGGKVYLALNAEKVYTTHHFSKTTQASRRQDDYIASVVTYAEAILAEQRGYESSFYVTPHYIVDYAARASANLAGSGADISGVALDDIGGLLVGDYRNKRNISRIHALPKAVSAVDVWAQDFDLVLRAPNDYAMRYADAVYDLPVDNNGHKVLDESVPFMQMVLEGSCICAGKAWNENAYNGIWRSLNKAVESKSVPYFVLTYEDETVFMHTEDMDTQSFFMTRYQQWTEEITQAYARYNAFWQSVYDASITEHEIIDAFVRKVTYDNGVVVYVNYGNGPYADGVSVPARDFLVTEEAK